MEALIVAYATQYPLLVSGLVFVGILRTINKPLFALLNAYVQATPSEKDDEVLKKVETSKVYTHLVFLLDYFTSIKLPAKK